MTQARQTNWQEAVARLARERTLAETCAGLLKKYGEPVTKDRGSLIYGDAKAEYDGIIAGLIVALARKDQPESLWDIQSRLQRGFDKREAFCASVQPLIPLSSGEKGPIADIVSGAIKPLIEAVVTIWSISRDDDASIRETIQTQLEATSWLPFASVPSAP